MTLPTRDETTRSFFVFARDTNTGVIKRVAVPSDLQVGLIDNPASLDLFGGLSLSTKEFSTTNENMGVIKIGNHDTVAVVSNSVAPPSGRISVYLPVSPRNGQLHFIKDASGTALSTPIDIYPAPGVFIDDETTKSIFDNFGTLVLFWSGDRWRVLITGSGSGSGIVLTADDYITILSGSSGPVTIKNGYSTDARIFSVGQDSSMFPSVQAAISAINSDPVPPAAGNRVVILVWPGYYASTSVCTLPAFVGVQGINKGLVEFFNSTSDIFKFTHDNWVHDILIEGSANPNIYAFNGNNASRCHIRNVDMLSNGGANQQGFLVQSGSTWGTWFLEHVIVDSYRSSSYTCLIKNTGAAARFVDLVLNDVFFDAYHLTGFGGSFELQGCQDIRFKNSTIRGGNQAGGSSFHTGIRHELGGVSGTPSIAVRHTYVEGGVAIYTEPGCAISLINSDAAGSIFDGGDPSPWHNSFPYNPVEGGSGSGADPGAAFVTIGNTGSLSRERALAVGSGLRLVDGGANSSVTLSSPWTESSTIVSTTSSVTVGPGITNFSTTGPYIGPALLITASNQVGLFVDGPAGGAGGGMQLRAIDRTSWELLSTADTSAQGVNKFNIRNVTLTIDCFTILSSGFTGIRNTNPQSALDVNGDINIGGNTRSLFFNGTSGSIRIAKVGNDLKFFDTYNAAGQTLSQLAGGADVSASYIIIGNTGSLPNERALVAGAGISLTDGGAGGTLTITNTGTPGSGADVSASYIVVGITGSLPNERALTAGTGISFTDGGPGGTFTINNTGTVQGSADVSASYITINNTGSLPNERAIVAGYGINFQDGGANDKFIISFAGSISGSSGGGGADVSASYVLIGNTGSLPNERALTAGSGISITDNGSNNTVVISATGGIVTGSSIRGQAAYQGFTSSSVFWSVTSSWTAFTGAISSNFTDVVNQSISRNGSLFQTLNGGLYYFHAGFNAYGNDAYVSLRLRNTTTNFVALQRATYRSNPTDQNLVVLDGVVSSTIGDTWQLEYVSSGTILPWTSSNPTPDGTNMRTGEVSMFLLPTPSVLSQTSSILTRRIAPDSFDAAVWLFNDASGSSIYANTGVSSSFAMTASSATTAYTGARQFFGNVGETRTNGYFSSAGSATMHSTGSLSQLFTLSTWVYLKTYISFGKLLIKEWQTTTWASPFYIGMGMLNTGDGRWEIVHISSTGAGVSYSTPSGDEVGRIPLNEWCHVGYTYDGASLKAYLNGVMVISQSRTGDTGWGFNGDGGTWNVGGHSQLSSEYGNCFVTDARVAFGIARNQKWFADVYANGVGFFTGSIGNSLSTNVGNVTPIFSTPILAGTVTTNTAHSASKQSLGMAYFNPQIVQNFGGTSRRYFYRAIVDTTSIEANLSASVDLYDLNGIVTFPPGVITGSIMSSSSGTSVQLQAELTTLLQNVSGSGILEARLWRTVSGTLASSVACRNARLDVEFS